MHLVGDFVNRLGALEGREPPPVLLNFAGDLHRLIDFGGTAVGD